MNYDEKLDMSEAEMLAFIGQVLSPFAKLHGVDLDQMERSQRSALIGVAGREFMAEQAAVIRLLAERPPVNVAAGFIESEKARDAADVTALVDTSRATINIGKLRDVRFTPEMWEVVKDCRMAGYAAKLDLLHNYCTRIAATNRGCFGGAAALAAILLVSG